MGSLCVRLKTGSYHLHSMLVPCINTNTEVFMTVKSANKSPFVPLNRIYLNKTSEISFCSPLFVTNHNLVNMTEIFKCF